MYNVKRMSIATLSSKNQITVPKAVRERLGLKWGKKVAIEIEADRAILKPAKSVTDYFEGLGRETWRRLGGAKFIKQERASWQRKRQPR